MTDTATALAIRQQQEMAGPQTIATMKEHAGLLIKAGMLPKKFQTPEQVVITMLYGKELGLSPMRACKEIHVINGNPGISTQLMNERIRQNLKAAKVEVLESTDKVCRIKFQRDANSKAEEVSYTIEEAKQAELTSKDIWKRHPKDMLFARCFSRMVREHCPDAVNGYTHTPEELESIPVQVVATPVLSGATPPERAGAQVVEAELVQAQKVEGDTVNEDAVTDLVTILLETNTETELEKVHRDFAEFWKVKSPATAAEGYTAYKNRLKRLRDSKAGEKGKP